MGAPRFIFDGNDFSPSDLFLGGIQGAWYDPSDLSTLFQDSAGTIAVTAVEQPVGKILDKSGNGNHATQAISAARPTLRARYNLLTYSEDWSQAIWSKLGNVTVTPNAATAPDGTTTADLITFDPINNVTWTGQGGITLRNTIAYTYSVWLKRAGGSGTIQLNVNPYGSGGSWVTVAVTNDWQRFVITQTSTATTTPAQTSGILAIEAGQSVYAWGAQLLSANDVTTTGNTYQSITTSTSYTIGSPFRTYLAFDGVDDSIASSSINISSSDKATVFSASTKFQDSSIGVFYEFSANINTNAGSFHHVSPLSNGYQISTVGSSILTGTLTSYVAPYTAVITHGMDIGASSAATELIPRVNAASPSVSYSGSAGTGNFGNYPLYVGMRGGASFPFNGRLYGIIFRGTSSSTLEIANTERWLNEISGAY